MNNRENWLKEDPSHPDPTRYSLNFEKDQRGSAD